MLWIVATPRRDLSRHSTREAAFKKARAFLQRGIGRRNMDVYGLKTQEPLDPSHGIGYRIEESYDIRVREGRIIAQRYSGLNTIGRPYDLGASGGR